MVDVKNFISFSVYYRLTSDLSKLDKQIKALKKKNRQELVNFIMQQGQAEDNLEKMRDVIMSELTKNQSDTTKVRNA